MFDVLMYLFETYIHNEAELRVDQDRLERDLTDAGFDREDIYNALLWLEKLADYQDGLAEPMQLASDPCNLLPTLFQCAFIRLKNVKGLMPVAGGSCYSLSRFRC